MTLVIVVSYAMLALPAIAVAIVHFLLDRLVISFTPLVVTLTAVAASEIAFRTLSNGSLAGLPNLDFFAAITGLICCLIADWFGKRSGTSVSAAVL